MSSFRPVAEQLTVIRRGVERIEPEAELVKKLERSVATGKPLRVKLGIDPTGFDVHLGHTVVLRKLRQFQDLGHTIVLIIGTATARVGDPSGRDDSRQGLTPEQIEKNAETYLAQIAKVIDTSKAEVVRNGDWFDRFDFGRMLRLLGQITMQRMLERDDFTQRINKQTPIYLHECLYPLMQGHDSVEVRADVELGGTEQLFNLMLGRDLQRDAKQEPQVALTMPILRGLDGAKKMGKSLNNYIGVNEPAEGAVRQDDEHPGRPDARVVRTPDGPRAGRHRAFARGPSRRGKKDTRGGRRHHVLRGRRGCRGPGRLGQAVRQGRRPGEHGRGHHSRRGTGRRSDASEQAARRREIVQER